MNFIPFKKPGQFPSTVYVNPIHIRTFEVFKDYSWLATLDNEETFEGESKKEVDAILKVLKSCENTLPKIPGKNP